MKGPCRGFPHVPPNVNAMLVEFPTLFPSPNISNAPICIDPPRISHSDRPSSCIVVCAATSSPLLRSPRSRCLLSSQLLFHPHHLRRPFRLFGRYPSARRRWTPPRFYERHDLEKSLPQHDLNLPYPQGREGRYMRFTVTNQVFCALSKGLVWGNLRQEILLNSYIAHLSKRTKAQPPSPR